MFQRTRVLPGTYNGLAQKVSFVRRGYQDSLLQHPEVRAWAEKYAGRGTRAVQAARLFNAVRASMNYYGDPLSFYKQGAEVGVEFMKAPWVMIKEINANGRSGGDCDDQTALNYTLLKLMGIPAMIRVGWYDKDENPGHIYAMAYLDGKWTAFDTTGGTMGLELPAREVRDFS